jgi:hypothetical protein
MLTLLNVIKRKGFDYGYVSNALFSYEAKYPCLQLGIYIYRLAHLVLLPRKWWRNDLFLHCLGLFCLPTEAAAHKGKPNDGALPFGGLRDYRSCDMARFDCH